MTAQSALAFPFMDKVCQMHFTNIDALRRTQGEALGMLGFGPNECDYHVILSGPHWCLRKYAHHDARSSLLIVPAPIKRPYIWDLAPSISVVRHCLDRHFGVYLLEWMPPLGSGKQAGLADYADHAISECVAKVSHEFTGIKAVPHGALARRHARSYFLRFGTRKRPGSRAFGGAALFRVGIEPVP